MRKTTPSILIALILVNLFAPFTLGVTKRSIDIKKSVAEADIKDLDISLKQTPSQNSISVKFSVRRYNTSDHHGLVYMLSDKPGTKFNEALFNEACKDNPQIITVCQILAVTDMYRNNIPIAGKLFTNIPTDAKVLYDSRVDIGMDSGKTLKEIPVEFSGLTEKTKYYLSYAAYSYDNLPDEKDILVVKSDIIINTIDKGEVGAEEEIDRSTAGDGYMPACWLGIFSGGFSISGCLAQLLYTLFFRPTSFLFGLAGMFFDWSFDYSVKDSSYKTAFVVEGWGIVRDFVNLFFIFVLLWIAFSTILNLHGFKTKEMIINVVLIGLLMNFSLFITQVIIDASNITARVFYNGDSIKLKDAKGQEIIKEPGAPIPLSEIIVSKVNPQRLILDAARVNDIKDKGGQTSSDPVNKNGISNGTFILVTLLASTVNVIGMFVFLSVGLIFIARVIGLWLAMILVPLAFFSYMVPVMQDVKMIGWKKWWPNTLKLAFLAPIFIFFMYLIVKFLGSNFLEINSEGKGNAEFVIAIIVPFAFIIVLLNRAKGIAVDFAGEIGTAVTKAGNIIGGAAVGVGVGAAAIGLRQTVGRGMNKLDKNDWLNDAASGKKGRVAQFFTKDIGIKKLTSAGAKGSFDFRQTTAGNAFSKESGMNLNQGAQYVGLGTKSTVGGYKGAQQRKKERDEKFGESLGYDVDKYDELGEQIHHKQDALDKFETQKEWVTKDAKGQTVTYDKNSSEYKAEVARQKLDIKKTTKMQERVKTGRQMEHSLSVRRQSGKVYDADVTQKMVDQKQTEYLKETNPEKKAKLKSEVARLQDVVDHPERYRDENGNIKQFGRSSSVGKGLGSKASKQIMKEFAAGFAKGIAPGAVAASFIPGIGTVAGGLSGGLINGIRSVVNYSGSGNRTTGGAGKKEEFRDTYKPGAPSAAKHDEPSHSEPSHDGGGDAHAEHH